MKRYTILPLAAFAGLALTGSAQAALWSPADITTALWFDASDASTIHTDDAAEFVSQWDDKSGNNNHATQDTESDQPQTGSSTIGGLNVTTFDGSNDYLTVQPFSSAQPHTVFFVAETTGSSGRQYVFDGANDNGDRNLVALRSSGTVQFWAEKWADSGVSTPTAPLIGAAAFNTSSSEIAIDGTNTTAHDVGSFTMTDGMNLGTNYLEGGDWLEGDIAEFIIVSGAPDTDTRLTVEGYLAHKWGLEGNLPVDHLYKAVAPTTAVPEPSSTALLGLGGLALILRRRR